MRTLTPSLRWLTLFLATIFFLTSFQKNALAQQASPPKLKEGVIRIKVTEALAAELETKAFRKAVTGEVITGIASLDQLNRHHKVRRMIRVFRYAGKNEERHRKHGLHLWYELEIDTTTSVSDAVKSFRSDRNILKAEPVYEKNMYGAGNRTIDPKVIDVALNDAILPDASNDPRLKNQWHYNNTGQTGGTPGADIHLWNAWKKETGSKDVIVAVTDAGIQTNHPDLAVNMWVNEGEIPRNRIDDDHNGYVDDVHGYSFVTNSGDITPHDHGTHVGGTIAAVSNNSIGVAGIAGGSGAGDGIRLMSCAVFSDNGAGGFAESYVYAADHGAVISQNSWGYSWPGTFEQAVLDAIDYFIAEAGRDEDGNQTGPMAGGLVIFAAGNADSDGYYFPGYYESVLAVAGSTHTDVKAVYSNFGAWVDVTAPGGETHMIAAQGVLSTLTGGRYGYLMGTSMACPHVSGVAALVLSRFTRAGFTADLLKQRIRYSVDDIDALNPAYAGKLGKGRLNAARALQEGDETPPSKINDLEVAGIDIGTVTLTWTSPADNSGAASGYEVRYATAPITAQNFGSAKRFTNVPLPGEPGATERLTVNNLPEGVLLHFAMKSIDFEGNISPVSNVVSGTPAFRPSIAITPVSITEKLLTAQQSRRTFTIRNDGKGPLKFVVKDTSPKELFATTSPVDGVVGPGQQQRINVSFDASSLWAGTFHKELVLENNDPDKPVVTIAITLQVSNNNAPIASVSPGEIDFKSVQVGTKSTRIATISNSGSDPLIISAGTSDNARFTVGFTQPVTLHAFTKADFRIVYSPTALSATPGKVAFTTNDPANSTLIVSVTGEGIAGPPIVVLPNAFQETLDQGTTVNRTLTLTNNGSQNVTYRIDMANIKPVHNLKGLSVDTVNSKKVRITEQLKRLEAAYEKKSPAQRKLLKALDAAPSAPAAPGPRISSVPSSAWKYITGFEEFAVGPLEEQNGWQNFGGFFISGENPHKGLQHLQGVVNFSSGDIFATSPYVNWEELYANYSYITVRLNIPASGASWQIIPMGSTFTATIIRFNADRTIDALVGENDYNARWERVPFTTPEGYFELAIAVKSEFSDTTYLPYYSAFIDHEHIFSGVGISGPIGMAAFASGNQSLEGVINIDELEYGEGEFVPRFIKPDAVSGIIPAGQSVNANLRFDAGGIDFGSFQADLLIHIDESDSLLVPVTLEVTGPGAIVIHPDMLNIGAYKHEEASTEMTISNTGGRPVKYHFESGLPNLNVIPASGTLGIRETRTFLVKFDGEPGIYTGELLVHTDFSSQPLKRLLDVNVRDSATMFYAPETVKVKIQQGQISTRTFQVRNDGLNTVRFNASTGGEQSIDPATGSVGQEPLTMTLTLDGRGLTTDHYQQWIAFRTNDSMKEYHYTQLQISVIPDTTRYGKISQEIWTGITGREISSIPVNTTPSRTNVLNVFEAPANQGDSFGSRIRGYIIPFGYGEHTFWIASNDNSELWLSTDDSPVNKKMIASVTGYTNPRQWDKYPSQKSQPVSLEGNKRYYIEAIHKETVGADHIAVGWQPPWGDEESPIPGVRLARYEENINQPPHVAFVNPQEGEIFSSNSVITLEAEAHDEDGRIVKVEFFNGAEKLGLDITSPYVFTWKNVPAGNHTLIAKVLDNLGGTDSATVDIVVTEAPSCTDAGHIVREQWNNVPGTLISSIPLQSTPSLTQALTVFEARRNLGDHYGARIRGFLCVPQSGQYTFWIASNDKSELWLSTNESSSNKIRIAYVSGYTDYRQWSKYPSQRSALIPLEAGRRYYIEALHKEGLGADHLSVGWQLPDRKTMERPIPGIRLLPFHPPGNRLPEVAVTAPKDGDSFTEPATIRIQAEARDDDGRITRVEFFNGTRKLGEDLSAPYSINWRNVARGDYSLTAVATDNSTGSMASAPVRISVVPVCIASGTISREYWTGVAGNLVSSIPVRETPDGSEFLSIFEGPDAGINYGARISGYLCPPATGAYYFWIASNDHSELWLSTDDNDQNKIRIAFVTGATNPREWTKFTTQRSPPIHLTRGRSYYIEALHKQGAGADHVAVGWQLPDGSFERPIGGNRLSPATSAAVGRLTSYSTSSTSADTVTTQQMDVQCYPNPVDGKTLIVATQTPGMENAPLQIEILQLTGTSVYKQTDMCAGDCTTGIDVSKHLTSGVYILQVRMGGRIVTEKLVVP